MKRTNIYLTDEQHARLTKLAAVKGTSAADITRRAIDWYLDITEYTHETMGMLERIHPDMTPEQIVAWLMFRWRVAHEGKDHRNGNGKEIAMLDGIKDDIAELDNRTQSVERMAERILWKLKEGQHDQEND